MEFWIHIPTTTPSNMIMIIPSYKLRLKPPPLCFSLIHQAEPLIINLTLPLGLIKILLVENSNFPIFSCSLPGFQSFTDTCCFCLTLLQFYKIRESKMKTLTRNWRDHRGIDTQKHTETVSRYFDRHGHLCQSEESKCLQCLQCLQWFHGHCYIP